MTAGNFNWFLHAMLFYHTQRVIQRQQRGGAVGVAEENSDSDGDEEDYSDGEE
jgi:hypothetical protein